MASAAASSSSHSLRTHSRSHSKSPSNSDCAKHPPALSAYKAGTADHAQKRPPDNVPPCASRSASTLRRFPSKRPSHAEGITRTNLAGTDGLDVTIRVEKNPSDREGHTEGYGFSIPALDVAGYKAQGEKW